MKVRRSTTNEPEHPMPRTAAPATPGTDPAAGAAAGASDAQQDPTTQIAGALAESPEVQKEVTLADAMKMIAQLQGQVQALGRNQLAQSMPERVALPELAAVMKQKPDVPVLTSGGWYVPPILPQQRLGS